MAARTTREFVRRKRARRKHGSLIDRSRSGPRLGVQFDVALFTNLTRDHLDYHRTMRRYKSAKARLFECASLKYAIVNQDDEFGVQLARAASGASGVQVIGYGFEAAGKAGPRVTGSNLLADADGVRFKMSRGK